MVSRGTDWDVRGKLVLITGGNSGIGKATAIELARRGARVVITSRDVARGEIAASEIQEASGEPIAVRQLDLANFQSIVSFAKAFEAEFAALHVLVHNAGLVLSDRRETVDGYEATFGTNHMGTFALNRLLLPILERSAPARIVVVASDAHRIAKQGLDFDDLQSKQGYQGVPAYARSKLANILFTRKLATKIEGTGVSAFCLHPGVVATNFTGDGDASGLWRFVFRWLRPFLLTPERGARTSVYLCSEPGLEGKSGAYFRKCKEAQPSAQARDDSAAQQLWEVSDALAASASLPSFDS
jgi:NAD(P)-dependent dehydrogenase (short-subunit alcohol dehydrogenase family)